MSQLIYGHHHLKHLSSQASKEGCSLQFTMLCCNPIHNGIPGCLSPVVERWIPADLFCLDARLRSSVPVKRISNGSMPLSITVCF